MNLDGRSVTARDRSICCSVHIRGMLLLLCRQMTEAVHTLGGLAARQLLVSWLGIRGHREILVLNPDLRVVFLNEVVKSIVLHPRITLLLNWLF